MSKDAEIEMMDENFANAIIDKENSCLAISGGDKDRYCL